jgi:hypothetical protein
MTAQPRTNQTNQTSVRPDRWLSALEQELKSRVGWADEAVSPFAIRKPAPTPRKIGPVETGKAA